MFKLRWRKGLDRGTPGGDCVKERSFQAQALYKRSSDAGRAAFESDIFSILHSLRTTDEWSTAELRRLSLSCLSATCPKNAAERGNFHVLETLTLDCLDESEEEEALILFESLFKSVAEVPTVVCECAIEVRKRVKYLNGLALACYFRSLSTSVCWSDVEVTVAGDLSMWQLPFFVFFSSSAVLSPSEEDKKICTLEKMIERRARQSFCDATSDVSDLILSLPFQPQSFLVLLCRSLSSYLRKRSDALISDALQRARQELNSRKKGVRECMVIGGRGRKRGREGEDVDDVLRMLVTAKEKWAKCDYKGAKSSVSRIRIFAPSLYDTFLLAYLSERKHQEDVRDFISFLAKSGLIVIPERERLAANLAVGMGQCEKSIEVVSTCVRSSLSFSPIFFLERRTEEWDVFVSSVKGLFMSAVKTRASLSVFVREIFWTMSSLLHYILCLPPSERCLRGGKKWHELVSAIACLPQYHKIPKRLPYCPSSLLSPILITLPPFCTYPLLPSSLSCPGATLAAQLTLEVQQSRADMGANGPRSGLCSSISNMTSFPLTCLRHLLSLPTQDNDLVEVMQFAAILMEGKAVNSSQCTCSILQQSKRSQRILSVLPLFEHFPHALIMLDKYSALL